MNTFVQFVLWRHTYSSFLMLSVNLIIFILNEEVMSARFAQKKNNADLFMCYFLSGQFWPAAYCGGAHGGDGGGQVSFCVLLHLSTFCWKDSKETCRTLLIQLFPPVWICWGSSMRTGEIRFSFTERRWSLLLLFYFIFLWNDVQIKIMPRSYSGFCCVSENAVALLLVWRASLRLVGQEGSFLSC